MTNFDINIVLSRLAKMEDYLKRLERYNSFTLEKYLEDQDSQLIAERLVQVITEAAFKYKAALVFLLTSVLK